MTQVNEALEGLNAEDIKILEDLKAEGNEVAGLTPEPAPNEPKTEEPPKEEPKKEEPKEEAVPDREPDAKKEEAPDRKPKYIPAWELAKQEKIWADEKAQLEAKLAELSQKPPAETEDEVKALADKYQVDEDAMRDIIAVVSKKVSPTLPNGFLENLKELQELGKATKASLEEQAFTKDFEREVLPLVRAEYPDISEDVLAKIRADVRNTAYDAKFLHTPLNVIYKGIDSFRGVVQPKKKSADSGRGGESRAQVLDLENLSEEEVKSLPAEDFIKYSEYQASKERTN